MPQAIWATRHFFEAAYRGNAQFMQQLLKAYPEEKLWAQQNKNGKTAFYLAREKNHDSVLELAFQHRAIPIKIASGDLGNTPFLEAAYRGKAQFMKKLLKAYPEEKVWTQQNKDGKNAFYLAQEKNHDWILELACEHHAIPIKIASGDLGNTPFLEAAYRGNIRFMKKLLEAYRKKTFGHNKINMERPLFIWHSK